MVITKLVEIMPVEFYDKRCFVGGYNKWTVQINTILLDNVCGARQQRRITLATRVYCSDSDTRAWGANTGVPTQFGLR